MAELNYEKDLKIDENSLDLELLDQASLFMKYAKHYAFTQKAVDEAKQAWEIEKAETDQDVRKRPEKYGLEKVTDKAIDAILLTDDKCVKAFKDYLDAKYERDMASNARDAVNQRKEMLEGMIKLLAQSYFAGPSVPHDLSKLKKEREQVTESRIGTRLKR
jgi:hypothetical protein